MSEFNMQVWQDVLTKVYAKATIDGTFRQKCLHSPHEAIKEVARDVELPPSLKVVFLDKNTDVVQPYLLPPLLQPDTLRSESGVAQALAEWHFQFQPGSVHCSPPSGILGGACTGGTHPTLGTAPVISLVCNIGDNPKK